MISEVSERYPSVSRRSSSDMQEKAPLSHGFGISQEAPRMTTLLSYGFRYCDFSPPPSFFEIEMETSEREYEIYERKK